MNVEMESTIVRDFIVSNPETGELQDADSTPTCDVYEDATDTPIYSPTVTQRTALTGHYRVPIAVTTANGFEEGKSYNVVVSATVSGISTKVVLASFVSMLAIPRAAVVADGANTGTAFKSDRTESTNDHWKDALIVFVTGSLAGQLKKVAAYDGTSKFMTVTGGFTAAPSATDKFILINA